MWTISDLATRFESLDRLVEDAGYVGWATYAARRLDDEQAARALEEQASIESIIRDRLLLAFCSPGQAGRASRLESEDGLVLSLHEDHRLQLNWKGWNLNRPAGPDEIARAIREQSRAYEAVRVAAGLTDAPDRPILHVRIPAHPDTAVVNLDPQQFGGLYPLVKAIGKTIEGARSALLRARRRDRLLNSSRRRKKAQAVLRDLSMICSSTPGLSEVVTLLSAGDTEFSEEAAWAAVRAVSPPSAVRPPWMSTVQRAINMRAQAPLLWPGEEDAPLSSKHLSGQLVQHLQFGLPNGRARWRGESLAEDVLAVLTAFGNELKDRGGWRLLRNGTNKEPKERRLQELLVLYLRSFQLQGAWTVHREEDLGCGSCDFIIAREAESVVVETKMGSSGTRLRQGLSTQLPTYMNAQGATAGFLVVCALCDGDVRRFDDLASSRSPESEPVITLHMLDARQQLSASKRVAPPKLR